MVLKIHYLTDRYQYVEIENAQSNPRRIQTGVPQDSILGPLLFIIYINDLINACKNVYPIIYADDTTLIATLNVFGTLNTNKAK